MKKLTTEEFIEKAKAVHGDKYDYSKVDYKNGREKICVICLEHGEFWQRGEDHLSGKKCKLCGKVQADNSRKDTTESFITKAKKIHGNKYSYELVNYTNQKEKVKIICNACKNIFEVTPTNHLSGYNCPNCSKTRKHTQEEVLDCIKSSLKNFYNYYDFSKFEYISNNTKSCVICPKHGEFWMTPKNLKSGSKCPKCTKHGIKKITTEEFIEDYYKLYGKKLYDLTDFKYTNSFTKSKVICKKHGAFFITPNNLKRGCGCPICCGSFLEKRTAHLLEGLNLNFISQKVFPDCKFKRSLRFDFYLEDYNILIECQGEQHYTYKNKILNNKPYTKKEFKMIKKRDKIKKEYCKKHNIPLLELKYDKPSSFHKQQILQAIS